MLSLVRAHGGTLDVTSEPGSTAFTLRIPLDRTDRQLKS